jgi:hypothetical protein
LLGSQIAFAVVVASAFAVVVASAFAVVVASAFAVVVASAFAVAVASEIGPDFSPGTRSHHKVGLQPPGCALQYQPQIPSVYAPNPTSQTIFHAFTQQNRMSSPLTHPKSRNQINLNKIKLSSKRFLVMVNQVQLN